jgi:hypothetical protein
MKAFYFLSKKIEVQTGVSRIMASDRLIKTLKRLQPHPITLYFTWSPVRLGLVETDKRVAMLIKES